MSDGPVILLATVATVVVITVLTVKTMRWIIRRTGTQQLFEDSVELRENGIDFLGALWFGRSHANYSEIESVKLLSLPKALLSMLAYGLFMRAIYTRIPYWFVLVTLKGKRAFKYLLLTPKNPSDFVNRLRLRFLIQIIHLRLKVPSRRSAKLSHL